MLNDKSTAVRIRVRQDGFDSGHEGKSQRSCPFEESTDLAHEWRCGWIAGWCEQAPATAN
ncbi:hypothetical protein LMG29542_07960 [Paraburkholderia humisilvae]|uniref:Ribosome modulation factor n=1 Tax=Paraburkholderia humisilvae TaxID=627669 RepID=A0A6J5FA86_9BURK|nr:hypothetical protein LMG29542_07960 [Paraburkholderia humisilvae]